MGKKIDLTGQRFGRLVVVKEGEPSYYYYEKTGYRQKVTNYECVCDCGIKKSVLRASLVNGDTRSCGCLEKENRDRINKKFIDKKIWEHENTLLFHEKDRIEKGTKITTIRPDRIQKNNKSGTRGVSWDKSRHKWKANIQIKGKNINLGRFHDKQDAIQARKEAEEKYFKPILDKYEHKSK